MPSTPEVTRALKPCPFCNDPMEDRGYGAMHTDGARCILAGYALDPVVWNTRTPARGGDELREALEEIAGLPHGLDIGYAGDIARAALASTDTAGAGEGLDRATLKHCAQTIRDRAVTISAAPLGGGNVSEASKIAARHLISAAEAIEKEMPAAPQVEGLTSGEVEHHAKDHASAVDDIQQPSAVSDVPKTSASVPVHVSRCECGDKNPLPGSHHAFRCPEYVCICGTDSYGRHTYSCPIAGRTRS